MFIDSRGPRKRVLPSTGDPVHVNTVQAGQAEHLVSAAVSENCPIPPHKPVQPPRPFNQICPGTVIQVKRIAQDHLVAGLRQLQGGNPLHGTLGPYRHEHRGFNEAVSRLEPTRSCLGVRVFSLEFEDLHAEIDIRSSA